MPLVNEVEPARVSLREAYILVLVLILVGLGHVGFCGHELPILSYQHVYFLFQAEQREGLVVLGARGVGVLPPVAESDAEIVK